jgi:hypothetical protein
VQISEFNDHRCPVPEALVQPNNLNVFAHINMMGNRLDLEFANL